MGTEITESWGGEDEVLAVDGYRVSVWKDKKDLEINDGNGYTTM